jgi:D-erythrulose 4-kinase
MSRGAKAAAQAADEASGGVETVLTAAGAAFGDKAGGTSGILWGLLLEGVGRGLGNEEEVTAERLTAAVRAATGRLQEFGKAQRGDKTMLDSLLPFVETLEREASAGSSLTDAWQAAAKDCVRAADETAPMVPKLGRARPLAERSVGTPDPGAVSLGLIVTAIGAQLASRGDQSDQSDQSDQPGETS